MHLERWVARGSCALSLQVAGKQECLQILLKAFACVSTRPSPEALNSCLINKINTMLPIIISPAGNSLLFIYFDFFFLFHSPHLKIV